MKTLFDAFYQDHTDGFSRPAMQVGVEHPYHAGMVKTCIDGLASSPGSRISKYCRIYQDGRQISPFEAKTWMKKASRHPSFQDIDWHDLTGDAEFMIFINQAALYSEEMIEASRHFLGEFCAQFEPDGVSVVHQIIIGRYSETPFGVHVDDATDRVFHFNIGPGTKEMILWPRQAFLDTHDRDLARPLDKTDRAKSEIWRIPLDGCFFLPADYYHVGRSPDEVTTVVGLEFSRQSFGLQLNAAIAELQALVDVPDASEICFTDFAASTDVGHFTRTSLVLKENGIEHLLEHARARRRSNNHFAEIIPYDRPVLPADPVRYQRSKRSPPQIIKTNGVLHLYSRGHHARLTDAADIAQLEAILSQTDFKLSRNMLRDGLAEKKLALVVLAWLVATGGVVQV